MRWQRVFSTGYAQNVCFSSLTPATVVQVGGRTISTTGMRANISDAFLDRIACGKGRIILTASGANEVSGEDDKLRHGVFTYFLLKALRGEADTDKDGMITVDEV